MFYEFIYEFGCTKVPDENQPASVRQSWGLGTVCYCRLAGGGGRANATGGKAGFELATDSDGIR